MPHQSVTRFAAQTEPPSRPATSAAARGRRPRRCPRRLLVCEQPSAGAGPDDHIEPNTDKTGHHDGQPDPAGLLSRPGENYYYGGRRDLHVGNTEVLARMMAELIDCDVHRIDAADPYPASYDATVARNVREQEDDARPAIANPLAAIDLYDTVLLGSPIGNVRPPMIMTTFTESHDFTGTTVHPFVTYAVSGLGSTERVYTESCAGARIAPGLAVRGEEVTEHRDDVETWLSQAGLLSR